MKFIEGDAFAMLGSLGQFDGVVTDPPYPGSTASNSPVDGRLGCPEFSNTRFIELCSLLTGDDAFLVFTNNFPNSAEIKPIAEAMGWKWRATQVWDKRPTRTWVSWSLPLKCVEYVNYYTRGKAKLSFKDGAVKEAVKRKSFGGDMKASQANKAKVSYGMFQEVVNFKTVKGKDKSHPTQKPTEMSEMIAKIVGPGKKVIDPFCGSGAMVSAFKDSVGVDLKRWQ